MSVTKSALIFFITIQRHVNITKISLNACICKKI